MATPTIIINSANGSDVAASGAGPATALAGTAASTSANGTVVTLDGSPDLTGVATDGSHVVWLNTASGRQFGAINAKDNTAKTVTISQSAYTVNLAGQAWAIGGKRASLDNANTRKLFSTDAAAGWIVDLQEAGSVYALAAALNIGMGGLSIVSSTANRPTITTSVNSIKLLNYTVACNGVLLRHLYFSSTAATRGTGLFPAGGQVSGQVISDCVFDGLGTAIDGSNGAGYYFSSINLDSCDFRNCTTGIYHAVGSLTASNCSFRDSAGSSNMIFGANAALVAVERCVFARCYLPLNMSTTSLALRDSVLQGSTNASGNALVFSTSGSNNSLELTGNVICGGLGGGVNVSTAQNNVVNRNNAYGLNAGANRTNLPAGTGDVALTADPFTNAAGNDFTLNATAGGGALLRGIVNNVTAPGLVGTGHADLAPFQSAGAASSASSSPAPPLQPGTWAYYG